MRSGADEALAPKYAHIERERRWLVDPALRPDTAALPFTLIEDVYVTGTRLRLRRMTDSATGAVALKLTKKYEAEDPCARAIVTVYLIPAEFAVLARLDGTPLAKRRYKLAHAGEEFSLDRFLGALAPLELAEIEWADDAGLRALHAPPWAVREISDDPRYQGGMLAAAGRPEE